MQHHIAQHVREGADALVVCIEGLSIAGRELRDFFLRTPCPHLQIVAIIERQEVRQLAVNDLQAVTMEFQVGDDFGIEQADGVTRDRVPEAGMKLLRHGGATGHVPSLEDGDLQAGAREVKGADQTVVARANHDDIAAGADGGHQSISLRDR